MICIMCKKDVPNGEYCDQCGTGPFNICPDCNHISLEHFCEFCGNALVKLGNYQIPQKDNNCDAKLVLVNRQTKKQIVIEGDTELGRNELCENTVSKHHSSITRKKSTYFIEDLKSTNGTFINGIKVTAGMIKQLNNNDVLKIGTVILDVCIEAI